jgi:hypothetical protein
MRITMTRLLIAIAALALVSSACSAGTTPTVSAGSTAPAKPSAVAGITLRFEEAEQFELTLESGRHIYIDIYDMNAVQSVPTANDILLTTVLFPHHYDPAFDQAFPGQKLVGTHGTLKFDDVTVTAIDSTSVGGAIDHANPTNELMLIEASGLRILACGDEVQDTLTDEQKAALGGPIDVALCPLSNLGGNPGPGGSKLRNIITELGPTLVLPTHVIVEDLRDAADLWQATYAEKPEITLTKASLPAKTTMLLLGDQAANYGALLKLTPTTNW